MTREELFNELVSMRETVYQGNAERGFWPLGKEENKGQRVMLIVGELGECQEAHRTNTHFPKKSSAGVEVSKRDVTLMLNGAITVEDLDWPFMFKEFAKDTYEDEMADVVIRALDFFGGYGIAPGFDGDEFSDIRGNNFGEDLFRLVTRVDYAYHEDEDYRSGAYGSFLSAVLTFCEVWKIDILQHVQWKLKYNASRPFKHGKSY